PDWSPDGKRIAFDSTRTGVSEIFVMDPDGNEMRQLTHASTTAPGSRTRPRIERRPVDFGTLPIHPCVEAGTGGVYYEDSSAEWSWSPAGEAIVYDRSLGEISQLRTRLVGSAEQRCLTSGEFWDMQPSWSPDGTTIAFVRGRDEEARIHLLRPSDGSVEALAGMNQRSEYPTFSPDATKLAYVRFLGPRRRLAVVRDLATHEEVVIFDSGFGLNNLAWMPDGSAVVLYSIAEDGWNDLYEASADGIGYRRLTDNTVTDTYSPHYLDDGTRLLFGQGSEVSPFHRWFNYDLYEEDLGSNVVRRLTWAFGADDRARYSPDAESIGFVTRRSGYPEIYLMDSDGDDLREVTRQPAQELTTVIASDGLEAGEEYFRRVRAENEGAQLLGDRAAAVLTDRYLARNHAAQAVRVGRMGAATFPRSWRG
ncbi:MAG: hypothetical protein R3344_14015, partial [Acidobacteriota bacterium]|nr:hypothetical protein [Acidobacteriota bacterium]